MKQDFTFYYFIRVGQQKVGAIRIVDKKEVGKNKSTGEIKAINEKLTLTFYEKKEANRI